MKLSAIAMLLAVAVVDNTQAAKLVQRSATRDDDDDGTKKVSELDSIMNRYDEEEKHAAYLKSPEFAADQAKKKEEQAKIEEQKAAKLQETLDEMELQKALEREEKQGSQLAQKQLNAAQNDEYLQNIFKKYGKDGKDGIREISKSDALKVAPQVLKKLKGLTGKDASSYIAENFENTWKEHDVKDEKKLDVTEAYAMFNEL